MYTKIQKPENVFWVYIYRLSPHALSVVKKMSDEDVCYFKIFETGYAAVDTTSGEVRIAAPGSCRTLLQHAKTFEFNLSK